MKNIKNFSVRFLIYLITVLSIFTLCVGFAVSNNNNSQASTATGYVEDRASEKFVYLSDYDYVKEINGKKVSYSTKDPYFDTGENIVLNGSAPHPGSTGLVSLNVNKEAKRFSKGITACAPSEVVYDVSGFEYKFFSTYYGVDALASYADLLIAPNSARVQFYIYTSVDGENWTLISEETPEIKQGEHEASYIEFSIEGLKYIKLKAVAAGEPQANHAVYGSPRLYNDKSDIDDKPYDFIKTLEEYDEILKASSYDEIFTSKENILLSRKLVDYYGYNKLQEFAHIDESHKRTIEWILSDTEALKYFVTSGEPGKSDLATTTTNALNVLHTMYSTYASDMDDATATQYTTLGNLYKRMIISISLAYATDVKFNFYGGNYENSDPVKRYAIYKKLHAEGNLKNEIFENLTVPQMRHVLGSTLDDEEIEWLNWYVREKMNGNLNCHAYMPYRGGNYQNYAYYNPANYDTWDAKYNLKAFNITYGNRNYPKLWMVYEQGAFCGGISQNGIYVCQVLGIPAQKMTQPVHGAYLHLTRDSNGQFAWSSAYDIYGVHNSGGTAEDPIMMRWGFRPWNSSHAEMSGTITYLHNVQHVLNDYENYLKAEEVRILADVYTNYPGAYNSETYVADGSDPENNKNAGKLKEIYEKVLEYSPYHLYGWYGLINAYKDDLNSTPKDFALIAKRISETMYIHPFPMYDLFRSIESKVKDTPYYASFTNYLKSGLEKGRIAGTDSLPTDYIQSNVSRAVASRILGFPETNSEVATFSFDGANAGKIILGQKYYNNNISWEYNLGEGWKQTLEKEVKLTSEEIASITVENDIRIHIVGVDYSEENIYTINIEKAVLPNDSASNSLYGNDLENRVVNITDLYEWRYSSDDEWISYATSSPDLSGNKSIEVRIGANANFLPSDSRTFIFTEDESNARRKYIPVSEFTLNSVSSQATGQNGSAIYALDANYNTRWHSNWNGNDTQRFISVKFDKPTFISAVEFVPAGGGNGKIIDGTIYGSLDGVTWTKLAERKNLSYKNQCNTIADAIANIQSFEIENPQDVLYIKIVADRASNGNWLTARAFNFYEDTTQEHRPAASIIYSTTEPTRENVTITLNNLFPSEHITITNNDGKDTFVFTENGEFTFEFVNDDGVKGSATAKVDWIDRVPPTAKLEYSTDKLTNGTVIVVLKPNEKVTVTNRDDIIYMVDEAGNVIDKTVLEANPSNPELAIMVGYAVDENGFVLNPMGDAIANINPFRMEFVENGEFTFELVDTAGNVGRVTVRVDWIDRTPPSEPTVEYDKSSNDKAIITITIPDENVTFVDGNGTYEFTKNGTYTIKYYNKFGELCSIDVVVDWLDETPPSEPIVEYDKSSNDKAIITITIPDENVTFVDGNGTYEFTKNGTYTIKYYNKNGELCSIDVVVDWLDETMPSEPIVEYDKSSNDKAIITITIPDENVTFVDGNGVYEFTKNGTYTIKYYNKNGELCSIDVVIDWLDESMVDNQNKDEKTNNLPLIIGIVVAIVVAIVFVLSVGIITAIVITKKRKSKN